MKLFLCKINSSELTNINILTRLRGGKDSINFFYYTKAHPALSFVDDFNIFYANTNKDDFYDNLEDIKSIFSKNHLIISRIILDAFCRPKLLLDEGSMFRLKLMGLQEHDIILS